MEDCTPGGYYPIALRLSGKLCIIIGGGKVAERKLRGLLESGADRIELISPDVTKDIEAWVAAGRLIWRSRLYATGDMEKAWLLIAATDDRALNASLAEEAEKLGILSNIADAYESGRFITPAVTRRGPLIITVTTTGLSPALAKEINKELDETYGKRYGEAAARLGELRKLLLAREDLREWKDEMLGLAAREALDGEIANFTPEQWLESLIERTKGRALS
ncbi:bifunctional precorrin-2 dehydrogenase/sirohydrochlorin ferrochelatase [Paenibacillus sp. 1011MAR3C5]|uniref:precorrin-2 dehydrogenase/sirohydrochlorin ferrochelatase family protein n=1 Tax=Paenibacillus sp. 1011MAR3C5 TaxID=1675787 RepID=UPI000E6BF492|nr:bifunctional precorrin-2 dehydrogenase/sirohydrochlorin ferrochelatase [Paenibacillus sp. 1011MAR3C5]RJE91058.1 bifunctional precorrin-2 dehydrogenase/sirohydrochlorin ferrochelatase [Paenibacillus sp. 1011MAR3C5]